MTTIEDLFAAIENDDLYELRACLAPGFALNLPGKAGALDAQAFCAAVAELAQSADEVTVQCHGDGPTVQVILQVALGPVAAPALADIATGDPLAITTVAQPLSFAFENDAVASIEAADVDGVGLADVIALLAPVAAV